MSEPATEPAVEPKAIPVPAKSDQEPTVTVEDLRGEIETLRGVVAKERKLAREAEQKAKAAAAGIDNGELERLLAERLADEREGWKTELSAKDKAIQAKEDAIKAAQEETRKREERIAELHLSTDFARAFLKAGGDSDALEDATDKARKHYRLNGEGLALREESLKIDGLRDEKGNPVDLEGFASGWLRTNYPRYFPAKTGSGASPSSASPSMDANSMTAEQANKLSAEDLRTWRDKGGKIVG